MSRLESTENADRYRGKRAEGDPKAWTTERDLIGGIRTTEADVLDMLAAAKTSDEEIFLALDRGTQSVVGSIRVEGSAEGEAELGFFAVDPDRQGEGTGRMLLSTAEDYATKVLGARTAVTEDRRPIRMDHRSVAPPRLVFARSGNTTKAF